MVLMKMGQFTDSQVTVPKLFVIHYRNKKNQFSVNANIYLFEDMIKLITVDE